MGTLRYHPVPATRGPSSYGAKEPASPTGSPYATMDSTLIKRSCPWTQTVRGFLGPVGHPDDGRWGLVEERLGQHFLVQCSPRTKWS